MPDSPAARDRPVAIATAKLRHARDFADATELANVRRAALAEAAQVPTVNALREQDRLWRPEDYAELPTGLCHGPGYSLCHDVFLAAPGHALTADCRFIDDPYTRLLPTQLKPDFAQSLEIGRRGRARWPVAPKRIERGILVSGPGLGVYGHYLLDFLPPLPMLDDSEEFEGWPLLLPAGVPEWVLPIIEAFGGREREIVWLPPRRELRVGIDRLCVPWSLREVIGVRGRRATGSIHPAAAPVFDRIARRAAGASDPGPGPRRIYVLRESGDQQRNRKLVNADEIGALLESRGFEPIVPDRLPFLEQVRLFANAEVVAGEAGSGLHGTVFSPPGIGTLEIRRATYLARAQPAIAVLKRHSFVSVTGSHQDSESDHRGPWRVNRDLVAQRLDELGV